MPNCICSNFDVKDNNEFISSKDFNTYIYQQIKEIENQKTNPVNNEYRDSYTKPEVDFGSSLQDLEDNMIKVNSVTIDKKYKRLL